MRRVRAGHRFAAAKRHRVMRPLSEVFTPGAPTLPERLRTLVVSPERELEPGMTVRASFTFCNYGGAPATGVRVRFNVPEGLIYLIASGRLDGNALDDENGNSPLLSRAGASIGDVQPGEERHIEIAYSVAGAIENGTTVELQAAVASFELTPVGSNIVRLVARSRPQLRNAMTNIAIETDGDPVPGSQASITLRVHNAGESSARDIVVVAPIPEHASYVSGSARLNGRDIEREIGAAFDSVYAPILVRSLPASASATILYRIRIDSPLGDGTQIVARAQVASQETSAFELEPASLTVMATPDFAGERTGFSADPSGEVRPGETITFTLTACNAGSAFAQRVSAAVELDERLVPVRGATSIDGQPIAQRRKDPMRFALGAIGAGEQVILRMQAVVIAPLADGTVLNSAAVLEWEPARRDASRRLQCAVTAHSEPAFPSRRNVIERKTGELVRPGSIVEASLTLANDGSAAAHDAIAHLRIDPALDEVTVFENGARLALENSVPGVRNADTIELGTLEAQTVRRLTFRARIVSPCPNRREIRLGGSLHTRELGETPLRGAIWRVDSHPSFSAESSRLELTDTEVLRPNQLAQVDIVVRNAGSDVAQNVRLRLYISPEARLESVDGATRERTSLGFGEIAPGAQGRARLGLRLLRGLAKEHPVTVDSVLTADAMLPVPLTRLTIATAAEPDFAIGTFQSDPVDTVDVGETVEWALHVRNGGDGVAHHVAIAIAAPESLIYVPNSTTVNDVPVRDVGIAAPFASERGIVLNDVDPGVEATIRWRNVVHNGLTAGTLIAQVAHVRYDGERDDEILSNELKVRAGPIFANAIAGLPFGVDGMLGPALAGRRHALSEDRYLELPPATPVSEGNGARATAALSAGVIENVATGRLAGTMAALTHERLARALRFLREARFEGLVTHLFSVRAFMPDFVGNGYMPALEPLRDALREEFDRLFIKLRLPRYVIAARDVETPSLRATIVRVLQEASSAHGVPAESPTSAIELRGGFDPDEIAELAERLGTLQVATSLPWAALARLLPDEPHSCAIYRAGIVAQFDTLAEADAGEFIDALQHHGAPELDAALDAMCASLNASVV
jgi:uncharacterized repeat protein (TIGR01451 family)